MPRRTRPSLSLPKGWPRRIRSAAIHAISLARLALTVARGQSEMVRSRSSRIERLTEETLLLKEELRLKDARMSRIPAQRRPHYLPIERLTILELRAARGWSRAQTADPPPVVVPLLVESAARRLSRTSGRAELRWISSGRHCALADPWRQTHGRR